MRVYCSKAKMSPTWLLKAFVIEKSEGLIRVNILNRGKLNEDLWDTDNRKK